MWEEGEIISHGSNPNSYKVHKIKHARKGQTTVNIHDLKPRNVRSVVNQNGNSTTGRTAISGEQGSKTAARKILYNPMLQRK
jgi:hypothetical protein